MDTSGFCQVGRHGTLSLLKSQNTGDSILTSFGIDDDELTFGSSTACSVRLYYSDVDGLHCKIVFDQFKAFLAIVGSSGVVVDECRVFPHTSGETSGSLRQTIIPLNNNSIFEIHGKRFKFNYPPKELRKALYSTPARPPKRALRLSMIHSAQVFSPRPSNDPRENLRILQSPMKRPSSPVKNSSPLKSAVLPDIEEEEIVLVQTNHPRVVEEERDLVILEDVPVKLLSPIKTTLQGNQFPVIQAQNQPPSTPRRRSLGGTTLHRAVLIRSAQRAVLKAEKEREEEQEELEVFGTVVGIGDVDNETTSKTIGDMEISDEDDETDGDEDVDTEDDEDGEPEGQTQKSLWRKSLEQVIPWSLSDTRVEAEDKDLQDVEADGAMSKEADYQKEEPVAPFTPQPSRKLLGTFMTPQPQQTRTIDSKKPPAAQAGRFSLGGQARRVIVEQPWKVHDLVLPPTTPSKRDPNPFMPIDPPSSILGFDGPPVASPRRRTGTPTMNGNSIPAITDEERKAIQERRRSAVRDLNSTPFWTGGAPGMSPAKGGPNPPNMLSPNKLIETGSPSKKFISGLPTKARPSNHIRRERGDNSKDEEDLDTSGLLDKIKETVNDMKRRRSVILGGSNIMGITQPPISEPEDLPTQDDNLTFVRATSVESPMKKVDFTKIDTPSKTSKHQPTTKTSPQKSSGGAEEHTETVYPEEPFSLLRPGALEGRRQSILSTPVRKEQVVTVVPVPLITVEDTTMDKSEDLPMEIVASSRTRLLQSGSNVTEDTPDDGMEDGGDIKAAKIDNAKPPSARRQRSKTPQPQMSEVPSVDVSQRASRSVARGKLTAATAPKPVPEETDAVEKPATRRVRKPHTIDKDEDEIKPTSVAPKRGRPRKNPVPTEKSQDDTRTAGKSTSKMRSRKTPTTSVRETDSEDDPLDSYEVGRVPPPDSAEEDGELDPPSTPEAQTKTKTQVPVTRGKVATRTKQAEVPTIPVASTRVRRTKANTDSQTADATPAVKAPIGRPRGRPKTPATAPANTGTSVAEAEEKENTIGSRSKLKLTEKVANSEAEELPVKLRVSRTRAAPSTRNAAKPAEQDDGQPPPKQRATRVMRTRTKTS